MANHGGVKDNGEYFVITPASRKVTVPHTHKSIGTVGDHNSEQITFECPQIVDGHDISQCAHRYVTWVNVEGEIGHDELQVAQVEQGTEGVIYLSWTIRNALTVAKGIVQFSVHFEDVDENGITLYRWSTATCKDCEILDSINAVLGVYEAVYVAGETLVISDYTPVDDKTLVLETNGLVPEGTMKIDKNGTYIVGEVAQVEVDVDPRTEISVSKEGVVKVTSGKYESQIQLSAEHDSDLIPKMIRKDVTIFGVTGIFGTKEGLVNVKCKTAEDVEYGIKISRHYFDESGELTFNYATPTTMRNNDQTNFLVAEHGIMHIRCEKKPDSYSFWVESEGGGMEFFKTATDSFWTVVDGVHLTVYITGKG